MIQILSSHIMNEKNITPDTSKAVHS